MATTDGYKYKDALRACDICGVVWHKSSLTRIGPLRWACPDDAAGLTAEQIARHNASVRPLTVKPVKNPRPPTQVPIYQQAEADIFNLVLKYAPQQVFLAESGDFGANVDAITGLDQARTAGWMAFYLGNLVLENRRPTRWIQAATIKLLGLCDSMLSLQLGGPTSSASYRTVTATKTGYGAFYMPPPALTFGVSTIQLDVPGAGICLLALLRAFQVSGLTKYRDAARAAATFLRRSQCIGLYDSAVTGFYAEANTSGARFLPGPFPEAVPFDTSTLKAANNFSAWTIKPSGLICSWALNLLRIVDGDAVYGDTSAVGDFVQRTDATLTTAVAAASAWWAAGAPDFFGDIKVGFGTATPRDNYLVFPSTVPVASSWGTQVTSANWALGVRSLWEISGYTGQAATNYAWLRGGAPNVANEVPTTWGDGQTARSLRGIYDPGLCLATLLDSNASDVAGTGYDWRTVGLLAPIQSARDSGSLGAAKDTLSRMRMRSYRMRMNTAGSPLDKTGSVSTVEGAQFLRDFDARDDLRLLTQSGLSLQTSVGLRRPEWTSGLLNGHYIDLQGAVQIADCYRYAPGRMPLAQG